MPVVAQPSAVTRTAPPPPEATAAPLPLAGPAWHPIETWRQPQGLPQNSIITITQTRDGYIWIGTKGGITRFDGVRFATFEKRAVSETEVWDTTEGRDGSLWIATYGAGLQRLKDGQLVAGYTKKEGLPSDFVASVCEDSAGAVWVGTDKGVSRLDPAGGGVKTYTKKDGLHENVSSGLLCEADGSVWVGTSGGGLHLFKDGKLGANLLADVPQPGSVTAVARGGDGSLWLGTSTGVLRWRDGSWHRFGPEDGMPEARGTKVHADRDGGMWVGCQTGLYEYRGERFERHDIVPDRTQKQVVTAIFRDHEGSLWIGHSALGLARVRRGSFATYSLAHGLAGPSVRTAFQDSRGRMWLGTGDGLSRVVEGRLRLVVTKKGDAIHPISSVAEDTRGRIWFGTPQGVHRFEPRETCPGDGPCVEDVTALDKGAISRMNTRVVYGDRAGNVWVGTDQQGLARYEGDTVTAYTTAEGLCDNGIRGLSEAADGTLWIGTKERGVCVFKDGRFSAFTEKDGLASDMVQDVYRGRDGTMWVATRRGLSRRLTDGRFVSVSVAEGLYADHIYGVIEDLRGNLWMGCSRGAFRVSLADLDAFTQGKVAAVKSRSYGLEDGLRSIVLSVGFAPTIARSTDGRVWFSTTDGVSVVDPESLGANSIAPQVHVEEVRIDDAASDLSRAAHAPPGKGDLSFRYTALSFVEPRRMAFRVRLEPYDPDWVDVGNLRIRQYTNIPPGRYLFRVKAANADGVWNEKGTSFELALAPHFYQTTWFAGLCVLGLALSVAAAYQWRVRSLRARERELQIRVEQATAHIKTLRGLLPICASCKKIRDDSGYWNQMETYIHDHSGADFSHSICPDCVEKLYPEYAANQKESH